MKTSLLLGVHSHQPIDNFDHVVLDAIARSYQPFFETLYKFPDFRFSAHYSGWLLEFIELRAPKLFALMQEMTARDQVEWLTGGFYEPVLASIPSHYREVQINKLSDYIESKFGVRPKGLWLTERVWDASIVADLVRCGVEYAVVDDYHLLCTGLNRDELNGWFVTENGGNKLGLFPISKALRYQVPFWEYETVASNIEKFDGSAIIFDDGEKFGLWPGTHEWVYTKGWLANFASRITASQMVESKTYYDYYRSTAPKALVYPPEVSYFEMGEWSLNPNDGLRLESLKNELEHMGKADEAEHFLRGATWKNFLVKYEESNRIHKRMLELSQKSVSHKEAKESILKAQCNDVLWHGVFGGLYLPNLRDNAYKYLIECEDRLSPKNGVVLADFNMDSLNEARFTSANIFASIEPKGAMLAELSLRDKKFNLLNTLKRRIESYHSKIEAKKADQADDGSVKTIHDFKLLADAKDLKHIIEDKNLRGCFVDHLITSDFDNERLFAQNFDELPQAVFASKIEADQAVFTTDQMIKKYSLDKSKITLDQAIKAVDARFVQEHNFHFAEVDKVLINGRTITQDHTFNADFILSLYDPYLSKKIEFVANRPFEAHSHMLYTVSQSESGVDLTAQGVVIALDFGSAKSGLDLIVTLEIKGENE